MQQRRVFVALLQSKWPLDRSFVGQVKNLQNCNSVFLSFNLFKEIPMTGLGAQFYSKHLVAV